MRNFIYKIYRRFSFLQKIHISFYTFRRNRQHKHNTALLKKYGYEAMSQFDKCMRDNGIPYSLAFGTLLGAVREHDFIPHDDDIDVSMWIGDYIPEITTLLKKYGFKLKHTFSVDNDRIGKEDTFDYKGVQLDIFYFYEDNEGSAYCCDFVHFKDSPSWPESIKKHGGLMPRQLYLPYSRSYISIDFKGIEVSIPSNYKDILSFRYGPDYMIPKPGWRPDTEYIVDCPSLIGIYKEYNL